MFLFDKLYHDKGLNFVSGVDEAGRGPLAGPVVAAVVILPKGIKIDGINDSKRLTEKKRNEFFEIIKQTAIAYSIETVDHTIVDKINILEATFLAMRKAVLNLKVKPEIVLVDGNHEIPDLNIQQEAIIDGDAKSACIACASILAKVTRDRLMYDYAKKYPQYLFEDNKGYGTKKHIACINQYGPCEIHRKTFAPVKDFIKLQ